MLVFIPYLRRYLGSFPPKFIKKNDPRVGMYASIAEANAGQKGKLSRLFNDFPFFVDELRPFVPEKMSVLIDLYLEMMDFDFCPAEVKEVTYTEEELKNSRVCPQEKIEKFALIIFQMIYAELFIEKNFLHPELLQLLGIEKIYQENDLLTKNFFSRNLVYAYYGLLCDVFTEVMKTKFISENQLEIKGLNLTYFLRNLSHQLDNILNGLSFKNKNNFITFVIFIEPIKIMDVSQEIFNLLLESDFDRFNSSEKESEIYCDGLKIFSSINYRFPKSTEAALMLMHSWMKSISSLTATKNIFMHKNSLWTKLSSYSKPIETYLEKVYPELMK